VTQHDVPPDVRKRLAARLKELRPSGMTQQEAVALLLALQTGNNWSVSRLSKIETNEGRVLPDEIDELFAVYNVDDRVELDKLKRWARVAKAKGVWTQRRPGLPDNLNEFARAETRASKQRIWEPLLVPAQCQTPRFAAALITAMEPDLTSDEVATRVEARMARQNVEQELVVILDEDVLQRRIEPIEVWVEQLRHLTDMVGAGRLVLRVIPRSAGPHPGHAGWFVLLSFADPEYQDRGYTDGPGGSLYLEDAEDVQRCSLTFDTLFEMALPEDETVKLILDLID
jgi:hypothetical protein